MKTAQLFFAASISFAGVVGFAPSAISGYTCSENLFGQKECRGTLNGERIRTTTSTNLFGHQQTRGTIGGRSYSETCSENFLGQWECR